MQGPSNLEYIILVIIAIFCGLGIRYSLGIAKQRWAMTYHHTMSYALLPPVTMIITTLISGNIALSLGMIGALSIVRFRNPVKNPFELVMFFALITIGIAMAVKIHWGLLLTAVIIIILILSKLIEKIGNYYGFNTFSLSFEEGMALNIIEIYSSSQLKELNSNDNLLQVIYLNEDKKKYFYRLGSKNKETLLKIKSDLEKKEEILNIELRLLG